MDILDLIFPKKCLNCGGGEKYICAKCLELVPVAKPICPVCEKASIDGMTHFKCKKKYGIDGRLAVWEYEGVIRKAILSLKYKFAREVSSELVTAFLSKISSLNIQSAEAILVPVPMHFLRENWRGFNQSEVLGKELSRRLRINFYPELLVKIRTTNSQTELKREDRSKNVVGVFGVSHKYLPLVKKNFILFDDVLTTGSTIKEAAKVLKRAGAEKVWGLTIAQ